MNDFSPLCKLLSQNFTIIYGLGQHGKLDDFITFDVFTTLAMRLVCATFVTSDGVNSLDQRVILILDEEFCKCHDQAVIPALDSQISSDSGGSCLGHRTDFFFD